MLRQLAASGTRAEEGEINLCVGWTGQEAVSANALRIKILVISAFQWPARPGGSELVQLFARFWYQVAEIPRGIL